LEELSSKKHKCQIIKNSLCHLPAKITFSTFTPMTKFTKHKRVFLIWLAIYPLITLLFYVLGGFLLQFPIPLRTLFLTLIAVPIMAYIILPFYNKVFAKWLEK
jgi:antibiotic biosynthesis monooxygenase (ABM) superfamily enzyme